MKSPTPPTAVIDSDDDLDEEAQRSIGELAAEFDLTPRTIRFYEARGLIAPERVGTTRRYTHSDRVRLDLIVRGRNLGFSLEDIADYLALYDADPHQEAQNRMLLEKLDEHLSALQRKRADLERAVKEVKEIRAQCVERLRAIAQRKQAKA